MNRRQKVALLSLFFVSTLMLYQNCGGKFFGQKTSGSQDVVGGNPFGTSVAALPNTFLPSNYPLNTTTHNILTVGTGKAFNSCQAAVDAAHEGDEIAIDAGYVCAPFILRNKGTLNSYIIIRSADATLKAFPGDGVRVSSPDYSHLAAVESPDQAPAILAEFQANHYYITGLEVRMSSASPVANTSLVNIGGGTGTDITSTTQQPYDITFSHCWIHGTLTQEIIRGVSLNGAALSIVDSVIEEIHSHGGSIPLWGEAIAAWNSGAGPFKIDNNELVSTGANVAIGLYASTISGLVPSDIQFTHNWIHKNPAWTATVTTNTGNSTPWLLDNLVRMDSAQRMLIQGNVIETNWVTSTSRPQLAYAFNFDPSSTSLSTTTPMPWAVVQDINIYDNVIRDVPGFVHVNYVDGTNSISATTIAQRLQFDNNVVYNLRATNTLAVILLNFASQGPTVFDHNTIIETASPAHIIDASAVVSQFTWTNNVSYTSTKAIIGNGNADSAGLTLDFPGIVMTNDVFGGDTAANFGTYAAGNFFTTTLTSMGFVDDPSNGVPDFAGLALSPASLYSAQGTGGYDPGFLLNYFTSALQH